ncbi:PRD domain-containing protein [Erysipelothrix inopinata]|uniref:PRD domain-containing protein n=1 Tax=Erysipelothrix inopinata TaxID=225084 RepID=A0A7G9RXA1_9FIRM|nr:PRD domain-containing protein [Erysipelothrix inopinata]QNN60226.1 PRD domain-containing protein [Erysipelothrix inopinata]
MKNPNYYKILKVVSNNCLLVKDGDHEMMIIAKGIGFKRSQGESISKHTAVEKTYQLISDQDFQNQSAQPELIVRKTAEILNIIGEHTEVDGLEDTFKSLSNHISAMLIRIEHGENIRNPFHSETKILYKESYDCSVKIAKDIENKLSIVLPDAEIDFLTLYVHSMQSDQETSYVKHLNAIVYDVVDCLEQTESFQLDRNSLNYARFIIHIKFLIQRVLKQEDFTEIEGIEVIIEQYSQHRELGETILKIIESNLDCSLNHQELAYVMLHLARLNLN